MVSQGDVLGPAPSSNTGLSTINLDMARPFEYLIKDNFFTEGELEKIWKEVDLLSDPEVLESSETTGSAVDPRTGERLKRNKGVFLLNVYKLLEYSQTFRICRKIFQEDTTRFSKMCFANSAVMMTTTSTMLMSYYEDNDCYLPHQDNAVTTVLYWLNREPKGFTGGDLYLEDLDEWIPYRNNTMIMFPSHARHAVSEIRMKPDAAPGTGRYCFSQFLLL